jgi:hypothetical protein
MRLSVNHPRGYFQIELWRGAIGCWFLCIAGFPTLDVHCSFRSSWTVIDTLSEVQHSRSCLPAVKEWGPQADWTLQDPLTENLLKHQWAPCVFPLFLSFLPYPSARALRMSVKIYSETLFLLVENYNYDHFCLASAGQGIFGTQTPFSRTF